MDQVFNLRNKLSNRTRGKARGEGIILLTTQASTLMVKYIVINQQLKLKKCARA